MVTAVHGHSLVQRVNSALLAFRGRPEDEASARKRAGRREHPPLLFRVSPRALCIARSWMLTKLWPLYGSITPLVKRTARVYGPRARFHVASVS
ncbi:hypothetical protein EVAR_11596_1 [Eumeta japonica]|uniref:Uncharacterized protein n=1 Tax=Eumeta variegata TaxID=151549 RepID=A0A4C1X3K1_EUMVA|nr:hypothetical protein EVAR_11596_1 [Eumeta japonica]